jgi:hypothetical protein
MKALAPLLILAIFVSGCTVSNDTETFKKATIDSCISICNLVKETQNLSSGPCLGNPINEHPGWVCDVVHSPRQAVDNLEENQCSAYIEGKATHFVEVDVSCSLIRAV